MSKGTKQIRMGKVNHLVAMLEEERMALSEKAGRCKGEARKDLVRRLFQMDKTLDMIKGEIGGW